MSMYLSDIMTKNVVVVDVSTTAFEAAKTMSEREIGGLVVTQQKKPIGIITERDLLKKVVAKNLKPDQVKVSDIMSTPLITTPPNTPLYTAADIMSKKHIRRLVIVKDDSPVGIVTSTDVMKSLDKYVQRLAGAFHYLR